MPQPSPEATAHSARLAGVIRTEIESDGPMGFDRFMNLALYAPGQGYYATGQARFGAEGDFTTAPAISPMFGRCIARQCAQVLETTGGGDVFELGAGDGALAGQVLGELNALGTPPERYRIFEPSAALREVQRERLAAEAGDLAVRVEWLEQPPSEPFNGVILANEVVDALPARRFRIGENGAVLECRVANHGRGFCWTEAPAGPELQAAVSRLLEHLPAPLAPGYTSEIHLGLGAWLDSVSRGLSRGMALLVDYGYPRHEYYHPQRGDGTLVCHFRHMAHDDPFLFVGLQDITAFVDFTALAEAADQTGMEVAGFTNQGPFLLSAGLAEMLDEARDDPVEHANRSSQARRLIMPGDMGDRFKTLALTRGLADFVPLGCSQLDLRQQLLPPSG